MSNNKHIIDTQDYDQLYVIMRSTFLQYSLNHPDNITQQLEVLNSRVIAHCAPKIYSELESYIKYKKDSSTLISPLEMPTYIHKDKGLEFRGFF
jgi:hypothetical protein